MPNPNDKEFFSLEDKFYYAIDGEGGYNIRDIQLIVSELKRDFWIQIRGNLGDKVSWCYSEIEKMINDRFGKRIVGEGK